jgi:hypothetical protein
LRITDPDTWFPWTADMNDIKDRKKKLSDTPLRGEICNPEVIGWAFSGDMTAEHTTLPAPAATCMNRRLQEGLLFHSDRGVQYCAASFRERLEELRPTVRQSMR